MRTVSSIGGAPDAAWQWRRVRGWAGAGAAVVSSLSPATGSIDGLAGAAEAIVWEAEGGVAGRESPEAPKCRKAADISMAINALIMSKMDDIGDVPGATR